MLIGYTFAGDANLDGRVNALDFNALAANFGGSSPEEWTQGDFNYDGLVDTNDFVLLASAFGSVEPSPAVSLAAVVPEPCAASLIVASASWLMARRRRNVS